MPPPPRHHEPRGRRRPRVRGRRPHAAPLAVVAACLLVAGCGSWGAEGGPGSHMSAAEATASAREGTARLDPDGVQRITLTLDDQLRFQPSVVRARTGPLEITFHDTGIRAHELVIPGMVSSGNLGAGAVQRVRLDFGKAGSYAFSCMYHSGSGMTGTIEIG